MNLKKKMSLSCSSMTRAGSFKKNVKTNHSDIYNIKDNFNLVHKSSYGKRSRRSCERNIFYQAAKEKFTILDNTCIQDNRLSWKAKGLHTYLMSLPEDWKICLSDLVNRSVDGRDSMNTAIKELENFGYLKRVIERKENGCFKHFCYVVFECPENQEINDSCDDTNNQPFTENPLMDKPIVEKPFTENPQLLTTNILNTNIKKTKLTNYEANSKENVTSGVSESVCKSY